MQETQNWLVVWPLGYPNRSSLKLSKFGCPATMPCPELESSLVRTGETNKEQPYQGRQGLSIPGHKPILMASAYEIWGILGSPPASFHDDFWADRSDRLLGRWYNWLSLARESMKQGVNVSEVIMNSRFSPHLTQMPGDCRGTWG